MRQIPRHDGIFIYFTGLTSIVSMSEKIRSVVIDTTDVPANTKLALLKKFLHTLRHSVQQGWPQLWDTLPNPILLA